MEMLLPESMPTFFSIDQYLSNAFFIQPAINFIFFLDFMFFKYIKIKI